MPIQKNKTGGRYDIREITVRVDRLRAKRGVEAKDIYTLLGIDKSTWSNKMKMKRSALSIVEVGIIADFLDAPTGWPFIDERFGEYLDREFGSPSPPSKKKKTDDNGQ